MTPAPAAQPVLDMALARKPENQTVQPTAVEPASVMQMIERLASHPQFDAAKLEKLIDLQMRVTEHQAKAAFDAAFPALQAAIPMIPERGKTNTGRYALLEDIIEIVRPILQAHGFSMSFRTEWPSPNLVSVVGVLTHQAGHSRESTFQSPADTSGSKNAVQALGSVVSYGQRYTVKDLLGIVSRGMDDDGQAATPATAAPAGFDDWWDDLRATADTGSDAARKAWKVSRPEYRAYVEKHMKGAIDELKTRGKRADAKAGA